ncbi:ABC-type transport auxiliary lipoprotein family protein [Fodinicurvata sediminis]|uniref:ABC-type transport auxiliary lipoprotein family protein n=1 Tax=Fodinicurvata sediminis TaxID=1121832 RepID=UPI0003B6EA26|nr:ABC-type transport auxiliary lipoprotein family protein [Fodinicurvata sediminis]
MKQPYYTRRGLLTTGLLGGAGLLSGCGSLLQAVERDEPRLYRLDPDVSLPSSLPRVDWHLVVADVNSGSDMDSLRIPLQQTPLQVEYFARANWTNHLSDMVANRMLAAFENSGSILNVGRESLSLNPDYRLRTEVRNFQAEYFNGTPPEIHVGLAQRLLSVQDSRVVATKIFETRQKAEQDSMDAIIRAFNAAFGKVLTEIIPWTLQQGESDYRARQNS